MKNEGMDDFEYECEHEVKDLVLLDVIPLSLGLETVTTTLCCVTLSIMR